MKVLAVELPALCQYECGFCRSPKHGEGNTEAVLAAVRRHLPGCAELYLTSNGETGRSAAFQFLVDAALYRGIKVSVLGASGLSIRKGLVRAEISTNKHIDKQAPGATAHAVAVARRSEVPYVMSMVDEGDGQLPNPFSVMEQYGAAGFIVRAKRAEGLSESEGGVTQIFQTPDAQLGAFPCPAYAELKGMGYTTICIGPFGAEKPLLGGAYAN